MMAAVESQGRSSRRVVALLGLLWLLLAAAIILLQLINRPSITVEWQTETEVDTAGFNVYRSLSPDGPYERLDAELIPSRGSATSGNSYTFTDDSVSSRQTYYYQLEDVEMDNSTARHEIVSYTAPGTGWWVVAAVALSVVFGQALLVKVVR
jgi:hypothetical protein